MKRLTPIFLLILLNFSLINCEQTKLTKEKKQITKPAEPCKNVNWESDQVIIEGYHKEQTRTIRIETYVKNSNFDSLLKTYKIQIESIIADTIHSQRSFNLPEELNSGVDFKIIFNTSQTLRITGVKTDWVLRYGNGSALGYRCEIVSFLVNGKPSSGTILLKNPPFEAHYY